MKKRRIDDKAKAARDGFKTTLMYVCTLLLAFCAIKIMMTA